MGTRNHAVAGGDTMLGVDLAQPPTSAPRRRNLGAGVGTVGTRHGLDGSSSTAYFGVLAPLGAAHEAPPRGLFDRAQPVRPHGTRAACSSRHPPILHTESQQMLTPSNMSGYVCTERKIGVTLSSDVAAVALRRLRAARAGARRRADGPCAEARRRSIGWPPAAAAARPAAARRPVRAGRRRPRRRHAGGGGVLGIAAVAGRRGLRRVRVLRLCQCGGVSSARLAGEPP